MTRVLVIGAGGMLGATVTAILAAVPDLEVRATARGAPGRGEEPVRFDVERDSIDELLDRIRPDWVVNCAGVIKPRIDERDGASVLRAIAVNAVFPRQLAAASRRGARVIELATDGVFSGDDGPYDESAPHDGADVYGQTKSLGEQTADHVVRLRCSIIGNETAESPRSLLARTLAQPREATLRGFTNQLWNGITTLHFARLCGAVIAGAPVTGTQHVVPGDSVTKAELLVQIAAAFGRDDLTVVPEPGPRGGDRRLSTRFPEVNRALWGAAGHPDPPSVAAMVAQLAAAGF